MSAHVDLEGLWAGPLSDIREGRFSQSLDDEIRRVLSREFERGEFIPASLAKTLWFMPLFLEWQLERVIEKSPSEDVRYRTLLSWVTERVGEILGNP